MLVFVAENVAEASKLCTIKEGQIRCWVGLWLAN
jgi:hypothetical protein